MIKNITLRLPEMGHIKIGKKGAMIRSSRGKNFQPPEKLDHFRITGLDRGNDGNFIIDKEINNIIGEKPRSLDIRFLYDDPELNFMSRYVCYKGVTLFCSGDGETAISNNQKYECPCSRIDPGYNGNEKRKPSGVLSVILDAACCFGGVWKFRTTSWNSVSNIMSTIAMYNRVTGGILTGMPFQLRIFPKHTIIPKTQKPTTVNIVSVVYAGTIQQLADTGLKIARENADRRIQIEHIEKIARRKFEQDSNYALLSDGETDQDVVEEYYHEQIEKVETPETPPPEPEEGKSKAGVITAESRPVPDDLKQADPEPKRLSAKQIKSKIAGFTTVTEMREWYGSVDWDVNKLHETMAKEKGTEKANDLLGAEALRFPEDIQKAALEILYTEGNGPATPEQWEKFIEKCKDLVERGEK